MQGYIKSILQILSLCIFTIGNAQLTDGIHFNYRDHEIVVFDYYDGKISLDYLGPDTLPFVPEFSEGFEVVDIILKKIELQKGDVMQLYFYNDKNDISHVYINVLKKKVLRHYKHYRRDFIPLCLGDCGGINDYHKIYILDISNQKVVKY